MKPVKELLAGFEATGDVRRSDKDSIKDDQIPLSVFFVFTNGNQVVSSTYNGRHTP